MATVFIYAHVDGETGRMVRSVVPAGAAGVVSKRVEEGQYEVTYDPQTFKGDPAAPVITCFYDEAFVVANMIFTPGKGWTVHTGTAEKGSQDSDFSFLVVGEGP